MERPRHLWYSPECKPWCLWNQFNAMRSLEQNEAIFQSRVQSLWQISLGIVLHEFQVQHGNHFHHEQPKGSNMLKVPGAQGIVEKTYPCCFDMCNVGQLRDPESGKAIRKRLEVRSTSQDLHTSLHRRWCDGTHEHQLIAGSTHVQGQPILRSEFTERYPAKFARQVVKILLHEKSKTVPILVEEAQEHDHDHPTKRRRLGSKMSTAAIDARFSNPQSTPVPSVSWLTVMQMADRMAARVGTKVVESGPLIEQVQVMCPDHQVKHVVLCRGTDRQMGPNKVMDKGIAPFRKMVCIRRKHEDIHEEPEWEQWERLTFKGLRRKCVPARVNLTIFAQVRSKPASETPSALMHERPEPEVTQENKRARMSSAVSLQPTVPVSQNTPDVNSDMHRPQHSPAGTETLTGASDVNTPTGLEDDRQVIDLVSQKHGPKFQVLSPEEQSWLIKIHRNMGHPSAQKLQQFCKQLLCPDHLVQAIVDLKCSTCVETGQPKVHRPSAIHDPTDFGDVVSMDEVLWTNNHGEQFRFYHFVDQSTMYHTAIVSPTKQAEDAAQALLQGWIQWAGPPKLLCIDAATELNSEVFMRFLQRYNIRSRTCATEAHWQNSRVERHGGILQVMLDKMDHEVTIGSYADLSMALAQATMTKNQWSRHRGFSPEMLVFGKSARIPGSVISDESQAAHQTALQNIPEGQRFREELAARERARKAFALVDNDQALRRALVGRSRPNRGHYVRGEWVMRWFKKGEADGNWIGPLQVIIQEDHRVVWLTQGNKLYRVAPEHIRPLSAVEEWHHISKLPENVQSIDQGLSVIPRHGAIQFHNHVNNHIPESTPQIPTPVINIEAIPDVVGQNSSVNQDNRSHHQSTPSQQSQDQPEPEQNMPEEMVAEPESSAAPGEPVVVPPTNPIEVPVPINDSEDDSVAEAHECFSLSHDECWKLEVDISQRDIDNWKREEVPQHMAFIVSAAKRQRSEVKLSQLSAQEKELFHDAKLKEINSWLSTDTVMRVFRHQIPDSNILRCRWILTWKPVDPSELQSNPHQSKHTPKARLVVLGYEDPQVHEIPRDSPTMTKLTRMLILQTAASMRWDIESFDIRTAFLRGSETSNRVLGIEPPDEMRNHMKLKPQEILRLMKGAYGRVDAPFLWFQELKAGLEQVGFVPSPFDPCAFLLPNPQTKMTEGIIGVHVDDGLCCGSQLFQEKLKEVSKRFPFGSHRKRNFTFTGLHIQQQEDYSIHIDQTQYVKDINPISLSRERRSQIEAAVSEKERQSLRAVIGSLQYAAVNTRPDLCSRLSWLQGEINKATIGTLIEANRILHEAKKFSEVTIVVKSIPIQDVRFVAFSDASFASAKNTSSHQGMMIMACHSKIGHNQKSNVSPIVWHSRKIQKVAVSTLSAEAMSLAGAVDVLSWIRLYWGWLRDVTIPWKNADQTLLKLPPAFAALMSEDADDAFTPPDKVQSLLKGLPKSSDAIITTDCKSLFDLISRTAPPSCGEFRTQLQAKLIKEHLQSGIQIRWVPSGAQVADSLTKIMDNTMLRECLKLGRYCLHDEAEILKARSDSRARLQWLRHGSENMQGEKGEILSR